MFKLLICSVFIASAFGGAILPYSQKWEDRIVGGEETTIDQYPYQVSVTYLLKHICGGTIINEKTVITAAHCTFGKKPYTFNVRAGTTYKDNNKEPGVILFVEKFIQHEGFTMETVDNDISIIKLVKPIIYSPKIQPIPLQPAGVDVPVNEAVIVTGWGSIEEGTSSVSVLRKVWLNAVSVNECKAAYGNKITENMFCATAPGKDACQGDSGGPVVYNGHLAGVVSWGIGCARPGYPGVFTRVSNLRAWLDKNINE